MESLALSFTSGWASGINAYLAVLVLGIAERISDLQQVPDLVGSWGVLAAAAVMYLFEFFADKIPYVDSAWDVVSTVIRPVVGGVLGVLFAGESADLNALLGAAVGGGSALAAHGTKAGTRLALNASPEPITNIGASVTEDVAVLGVVWFAIAHPYAAAAIAGVLLVLGLAALWFAARLVRRGWSRIREWSDRRGARGGAPAPGAPG